MRNRKATAPVATFSVTPTIGGYLFSSDDALKASTVYGMKFSYDMIGNNISDSLGVEGTVNYFSYPKTGDKDVDGYLLRVDAIYSILPKGKTIPFLTVGLGEILLNNNGVHDNNPLLNYGVGVKHFFEDYLAFRVDARHLLIYKDVNTKNNFELSTGLTYYFGKERKKKPAPPAPKVKPAEGAKAKLNGSAPGLTAIIPYAAEALVLEKLGAVGGASAVGYAPAPPVFQPAFPAAPQKAPALAFKRPSIPSPKAAQPVSATPSPAVVAAGMPAPPAVGPAAAPPKSALPSPPAQVATQVPVAPVAAPETASVRASAEPRPFAVPRFLKSIIVEFDFNRYEIRPRYAKQLKEAAAMINAMPNVAIDIVGHTDSIGKSAPNKILSDRRANSLKNELIKLGVDPAVITTKGFGFTQPKAANKTRSGRQKNRRAFAGVFVMVQPGQTPP